MGKYKNKTYAKNGKNQVNIKNENQAKFFGFHSKKCGNIKNF